MSTPRVLVIGIDGATPELIKPWAEAAGSCGGLRSVAGLAQHEQRSRMDLTGNRLQSRKARHLRLW